MNYNSQTSEGGFDYLFGEYFEPNLYEEIIDLAEEIYYDGIPF